MTCCCLRPGHKLSVVVRLAWVLLLLLLMIAAAAAAVRYPACRDNDDALCAVCGDGSSEPPNEILFCERCDLAVHQVPWRGCWIVDYGGIWAPGSCLSHAVAACILHHSLPPGRAASLLVKQPVLPLVHRVGCAAHAQACYGIEAVPEGEWLCWPCTDYEASLRKQGQSQATIRPPRWVHACDQHPCRHAEAPAACLHVLFACLLTAARCFRSSMKGALGTDAQ